MFYRGSIPPPLTVTPKFNYMEKELLTIELSHHDLAPETITIGIYDTIDEENGEIHVDLGNGLGEGVYPSTDWTIEEAINDQLQLFNNY